MNIPVRLRLRGLAGAALGAAAATLVAGASGCVAEQSARDFLSEEDVVLSPVQGDMAEVETGD